MTAENPHWDNVYINTRTLFENYKNPQSEKIEFLDLKLNTGIKTIILFEQLGSIEAAAKYLTMKPVVLNFANGQSPCWNCVTEYTQEEDLFRRTTLGKTLTNDLYPLNDSLIVSKNVTVIKTGQMDNYYSLLKKSYKIDIISCAALFKPRLRFSKGAVFYSNMKDKESMRLRIRNVLYQASKISDVFIVGAWGCGAFENPVTDICILWKEEIKKCRVKIVIFAIPDKFTYDKFQREFV